MFRKCLLAAACALAGLGQAHAALLTGDIAFTSFNADEDGFAIVAFKDIAPNTTIFFRDDEWNGTSFNTGEGLHTWSTGVSAILAGTVVRFSAVDQASRAASIGTLSSTGDTGLNATSETIYAYLGTNVNTPTTFLAGVSTEGATNLTPAGLTGGTTAVILTNSTDFAQYTGTRAGQATFAAYATFVNNPANWNIIVGGDNGTAVPNTTAFTVVPVPAALPLLLSGLGLFGAAARRRV